MLEIITVEEKEKWNKIVRSFADYEVFYLNEYVQAFQMQGNGDPLLFYYEDVDGRAMNVVMKRDIALDKQFEGKLNKNKYYDISTPYGYGGIWYEKQFPKKFLTEYEDYCRKNGYVSEFIRFELFQDFYKYYDGEVETRTHNIVRNLEMPLDEMLMDFEHKVRKNLKKAVRNELCILIDEDGSRLDDFLKIYYETMERNEASDSYYFSKEFYEKINEMKDNIVYFYVMYEEKIISTELVIYGAKNAYSYLGGTDSNFYELRPNDFLKFEIIKWCKEKGLENFVLGGGYGEDDGIFRYKKSLAPNGVRDFYIGRKIINETVYKELVEIRQKMGTLEKESQYFPEYRS